MVNTIVQPSSINVENTPYPCRNSLREQVELAQKLKIGDIILTHYEEGLISNGGINQNYVIAAIQKLAQWIFRVFRRENNWKKTSNKIVHVAQVVEIDQYKVKIAEAMPKKTGALRIVDLLSQNCYVLEKGEKIRYEVMRLEDQELAQESARVAKLRCGIGSEAAGSKKGQLTSKFSFYRAFKAIFKNPTRINTRSRRRLFNNLADNYLGLNICTSGKKARSFFCSYFVGHNLQTALISKVFQDFIAENPEFQQSLDNLENRAQEASEDKKKLGKIIGKWSKQTEKQYGKKLQEKIEKVSLKSLLDPKHTGPQDFYKYWVEALNMQAVVNILPPKN